MRQQQLKGTGVALITPFKNGKIDFPALERVINHTIDGGVDYLVSLGTTGEAVTIKREDCKQILKFTLEVNDGRVPVVAGLFGGHWTEGILERLEDYDLNGFAAIMSSSPNYNKPSQEGIFQHYMKIEEASPLPIIIYNVPGRTASNIEAATTLRLANASEKFVAVKEASGKFDQIQYILKHRPKGFMVLSGDDPLTLAMMAEGGEGAISVIANAFPSQFSGMTRAALKGDFAKARELNQELLDIHPWLYKDGNPAGIKAAMKILGFCNDELLLPLVPVSDGTREGLKREMEKVLSIA